MLPLQTFRLHRHIRACRMSPWHTQLQGLTSASSRRTKALTRTRRDEAKRIPRMIKQVNSGAAFVAETMGQFSGDEQLTTMQLSKALNLHRTTTLKRLWALEAAGLITRISASNQTRWVISPNA